MNKWVEKSFELSAGNGYLDKLHNVYPVNSNLCREVDEDLIKEIMKKYEEKDKQGLMEDLIKLEKFPIDNFYVGILRHNKDIRDKNPETVEEIADIILALDSDLLITACKQPKKNSRQMGALFRNWLRTKYSFLRQSEFESANFAFLDGSDTVLKNFANKELGADLNDLHKGLDFIFKKNGKYAIGEAKFVSAKGGTQDNQFNNALTLTEKRIANTTCVAVVDGIVWFDESFKRKIMLHQEKNILSALLLENFINEF